MPHLDEGTIHAWIEGALPPDEAAMSEEHIAGCDECSAAVAEARGLIAASSRILTALDDVPDGVIPSRPPETRPWYMRRELQAAAAVLIVAGTTLLLMNGGRQQETAASRATFAVTGAAIDTGVPAPSPAATSPARAVESGKREAVESKVADAAARMPAVSRRSLQKPTERDQAGETAEPLTVDAAKQRFNVATGIASVTAKAPAPEAPAAKVLPLTVGPGPATIDTPIRVVNFERRIGGNRTTYEVSPGVQVILVEQLSTTLDEIVVTNAAEPKRERTLGAAVARPQSTQERRKDSTSGVRDTTTLRGSTAGAAQTAAPSAAMLRLTPEQTNSIQWTDPKTGTRYTLSGPVTREQLEWVKAHLTEAKR
jgi:hypothetical protein